MLNKIEIKGNQRISSETIKMFANVSLGNDFDSSDFNITLKNLYDSDFFNLIELKIENNILNIYVEEYPIIQNLFIEGIEKKKIKDELIKNISFKPRNSFNKIEMSFHNQKLINWENKLVFTTRQLLILELASNLSMINYI